MTSLSMDPSDSSRESSAPWTKSLGLFHMPLDPAPSLAPDSRARGPPQCSKDCHDDTPPIHSSSDPSTTSSPPRKGSSSSSPSSVTSARAATPMHSESPVAKQEGPVGDEATDSTTRKIGGKSRPPAVDRLVQFLATHPLAHVAKREEAVLQQIADKIVQGVVEDMVVSEAFSKVHELQMVYTINRNISSMSDGQMRKIVGHPLWMPKDVLGDTEKNQKADSTSSDDTGKQNEAKIFRGFLAPVLESDRRAMCPVCRNSIAAEIFGRHVSKCLNKPKRRK